MPPQSDKKKKTKQNRSRCGHPSICHSCSRPSLICPFSLVSAATSSFLLSSPEHYVSRFIFFGLSFTQGRMGTFLRPSRRKQAQSSTPCASHTTPQPSTERAGVPGASSRSSCIRDGERSKCHGLFQGQLSELSRPASRGFGRAHRTGFAFQNHPSSGAVPYLPSPSAPGDTIPFLHQLGVFGSKGNLVPPQ